MTDGFLGISWFVWAALAAALAAVFTVIQIPKQTSQTTGFTHIVPRWFHSVTWDFLALSFLVRRRRQSVSDGAGAHPRPSGSAIHPSSDPAPSVRGRSPRSAETSSLVMSGSERAR